MSREYHHLTNEQKTAICKTFAKLPVGMSFTERVKESFAVEKVVIRKPDEDGKYYPSFFPWLKSVEKVSSVGGLSKPDRSAKKSRLQTAPTTAAATPAPANPITAAVRALADSLVEFVLAEVTQSLQSSVVSLAVPGVAAPLRGVGRVPEQKQPAAGTAAATPDSLHTLTDQQLRDRLGVAKAANNLGLCAKITNVLRMRDRSATVIANTHCSSG
jgi:hypothetical protein